MDIKEKVILITGGAVRIGREVSWALAAQRARLIIQYRHSEKKANKLVRAIRKGSGIAVALPCDLSDSAQVQMLAERAIQLFGRVDVLINNASEFFRTPLASVDEERWDYLLDVNLKAPFLLSQFLGLQMAKRKEGKIINIADIAAFRPWAEYIPYSVSKAGLVALTQGLAKALAPKIQVNAIAPGTILPAIDGWSAQRRRQTLRSIPLKRMGSPKDVANAVLFLIQNDYITGAVIPVDGGEEYQLTTFL